MQLLEYSDSVVRMETCKIALEQAEHKAYLNFLARLGQSIKQLPYSLQAE